jgi:hypothetical protein
MGQIIYKTEAYRATEFHASIAGYPRLRWDISDDGRDGRPPARSPPVGIPTHLFYASTNNVADPVFHPTASALPEEKRK